MKKGLTLFVSLMTAGLMLTGCSSTASHHHESTHPKTTAVKEVHHRHAVTKDHRSKKSKKSPKVNKKDIDKSGLSTKDIKKDSRAVHQKKSSQPVD